MSDDRREISPARMAAGVAMALMLASCAGPATTNGAAPSAGVTGPQFANAGGVNVAMPEFQNSAFPYHGLIPASADNPSSKPFLNVADNGRYGHESPRGGTYWEDATYNDRHVLLAASQSFDSRNPGDLVI